jgi:hypothetical protein
LNRHARFSPQLGEKPREFNVLPRTHAPQQKMGLAGIIYSITSSARASSVDGTSMPSVVAVSVWAATFAPLLTDLEGGGGKRDVIRQTITIRQAGSRLGQSKAFHGCQVHSSMI